MQPFDLTASVANSMANPLGSPDFGTSGPSPRPIAPGGRHAHVTATVTAAAAFAPYDEAFDAYVGRSVPEATVAVLSPSHTTSIASTADRGSQFRLRLTVMLAALAVILEVVTGVALAIDIRLAGASVAAFVACLVGMRLFRVEE